MNRDDSSGPGGRFGPLENRDGRPVAFIDIFSLLEVGVIKPELALGVEKHTLWGLSFPERGDENGPLYLPDIFWKERSHNEVADVLFPVALLSHVTHEVTFRNLVLAKVVLQRVCPQARLSEHHAAGSQCPFQDSSHLLCIPHRDTTYLTHFIELVRALRNNQGESEYRDQREQQDIRPESLYLHGLELPHPLDDEVSCRVQAHRGESQVERDQWDENPRESDLPLFKVDKRRPGEDYEGKVVSYPGDIPVEDRGNDYPHHENDYRERGYSQVEGRPHVTDVARDPLDELRPRKCNQAPAESGVALESVEARPQKNRDIEDKGQGDYSAQRSERPLYQLSPVVVSEKPGEEHPDHDGGKEVQERGYGVETEDRDDGERDPPANGVLVDQVYPDQDQDDEQECLNHIAARLRGEVDHPRRHSHQPHGQKTRVLVVEFSDQKIHRGNHQDSRDEHGQPQRDHVVAEEHGAEVGEQGVQKVVVRYRVIGKPHLQGIGRERQVGISLIISYCLEDISQPEPESHQDQEIKSEPVENRLLLPEVPVLFDSVRGFPFDGIRFYAFTVPVADQRVLLGIALRRLGECRHIGIFPISRSAIIETHGGVPEWP